MMKVSVMKTKSVYVLVGVLMLSGCASVAERNPDDPYESYNRAMFKFNDKADQYVMKPIARGYEKVVPQVARTGVSNFVDNLRDVVSFGSNVLRGDLNKAGTDLVRVTVNTTVGLGGLINIADKEGIPNNKNTLGDTFASWGWKKSNYFVFPLAGPSTVRDSLGTAIVSVYPVENAIIHDKIARYALRGATAVDTRARYLPMTDMVEKSQIPDKYAYIRNVYMSARNKQVGLKNQDDVDIDELIDPETSAVETTTPTAQPTAPNVKTKQHFQPFNNTINFNEKETETSPFSQQIWQYQSPDL